MNFKKLMSLMLAFVMLLSVVAPTAEVFADQKKHNTDVVIHKLKVDEAKIYEVEGYNGSKIDDLKKFQGANASELNGVSFTYWSVSKEQHDEIAKDPSKFDDVAKVKAKYTSLGEGTTTEVTANGQGVTVKGLEDGYYWFVENADTAKLEDGKTISKMAAVPFGLKLPVYKADGTSFGTGDDNALHVYPKNTVTDKPKVDKDFEGKANANSPRGDKNKAESHTVGEVIPYEIQTFIPKGAQYKTASWSDKMTEGLTFNQDSIKVYIGDPTKTEPIQNTNYKVEKNENGFKLYLNDSGLKLINEKEDETKITIKYTATLNSAAVVNIPESNDVTFYYGRNPNHGNTPVPNKPSDGSITVTKTWDNGIKLPEKGIDVEFTLYNAQTGEKVTLDKQENPKKIHANKVEQITHTWTGLDNNTEYKVVETWNGYTPEYGINNAGNITVKNYKDDNPKPIKPEEPKVVTYGKKFVKTDDEEKPTRLGGAQFVVTNQDGSEFLARKTTGQQEADTQKLDTAKKNLDEAIKAYNERNNEQDANNLLKQIAKQQQAYDKAFVEAKTGYTWVKLNDTKNESLLNDKENNLVKLTSNEDGQFEITGLKEGTYNLREIKQPEGYALSEGQKFEFKVDDKSYTSQGNIDYEKEDKDKNTTDAQQVKNKKVTIPQTGGIGTIIFTVAGLIIMGGAIYALKKNNQEVEA